MKQQNFLFVDIISSIFLLIILIGNFMGLLYISDGSIPFSLLGSMFLVVCYFFTIQQLKKNKELMFRKNFLHPSSIFWVFFLVLGIVSFNLISHFINVEYNCKNEIKNEATNKISSVNAMLAEYQLRARTDIADFGVNLSSEINSYLATRNSTILRNAPYRISEQEIVGLNASSTNGIVDIYEKVMTEKINIDLKTIKADIKNNNLKYQNVFNNWQRLKLVGTYANLNKYVEDKTKLINDKITELPYSNTKIIPNPSPKQLPLNSPSELNAMPGFKPNYLIPIIVILLTHLFILIPFYTWYIPDYEPSLWEKIKKFFSGKTQIHNLDPLEIENVREI